MILLLLSPLLSSVIADPTLIQTPLGAVKGREGVTSEGVPTLEYLGIPYAVPPTGERRFLPPSPITPWQDTFYNATEYGPKCSQVVSSGPEAGQIQGEEDCLYLNIFVPKDREDLLPVMVFIHGGAFVEGSGQDGTPDPFMDRGVMVVMINYRLGSLGFLTFGNKLVSGNMGLRDQLVALQWVQDNIQSYGGDPEQVTIFGESAGAISVHAHVLSPLGQGLYHHAIAQSGVADLALLEDAGVREEVFSTQLAVALNCTHTNHTLEMLECLQQADIDTLLVALSDPESLLQVSVQWWMVIDNYAEEPFLPETPLRIMRSGKFKNIPFMSGTMSSEGGFMVSSIYDSISETGQYWDSVGPFFTGLTINQDPAMFTEEQLIMARLIRDVYTGGNFTSANLPALLKLFTHVGFLMPEQKTVSMMAMVNPSVFNYQMTFKDSFSLTQYLSTRPDIDFGPIHADDLYYQFKNVFYPWVPDSANYTEKEQRMSDIMMEYWTNFAKFSDPSPPTSSLPVWEPVPPTGETNLLNLKLEPEMMTEVDKDKKMFWQRMVWDHREGGEENKVGIGFLCK